MAYATTNPPVLLVPKFTGGGNNIWAYSSTDATATVDTIGYFTNALDLGMKAGDLVIVRDTATVLTSMHYVHAVTSTATDLGTGISIGSSANAD